MTRYVKLLRPIKVRTPQGGSVVREKGEKLIMLGRNINNEKVTYILEDEQTGTVIVLPEGKVEEVI